jgi:ceramide glucosyltransferase
MSWPDIAQVDATQVTALVFAAIACLARLAAAATLFGLAVAVLGALAVWRFTTCAPRLAPVALPPVSVLRPLCGAEAGLDAALETLAAQTYPSVQLVFGVQDPDDPALAAVRRLRRRHPGLDIAVAVDARGHGPNRKVCNLINMLPLARHAVLVFSDSDLHVPPDYLRHLVATLAEPGVGLVTTLCTGLPTVPGLAARLGAMQITQGFLPAALLSRHLGRQDCLGTTMALGRDTLARVGGLAALVGHLADDNVLGQLVRRLGLRVALAATVPGTAVPEATLRALWRHELRWARTIAALVPVSFAASSLQFPLAWAALAWLCAPGEAWAAGLATGAWLVRGLAAGAVSALLARHAGRSCGAAPWRAAALLPARDLLSVAQVAASYRGGTVLWRGHVMQVDAGQAAPAPAGVPHAMRLAAEFAGPPALEPGV